MKKIRVYETPTGLYTDLLIYEDGAGGSIQQFFRNQPTGYILLSEEELVGLREALNGPNRD